MFVSTGVEPQHRRPGWIGARPVASRGCVRNDTRHPAGAGADYAPFSSSPNSGC
jgi:hypothetical protein